MENRPLVKFIRNYIWDSSGLFSISSLVRISMTPFPALSLLFVQNYSCPYNTKKITRWLEDKNNGKKQYFTHSLRSLVKILFLPLENKFKPFANIGLWVAKSLAVGTFEDGYKSD